MKYLVLSLLFSSLGPVAWSQSNSEKIQQIEKLERLAFGSCNNHVRNQVVWKEISRLAPTLFMWGGDIVYADGNGPEAIRDAYIFQNTIEDYKKLKAHAPVIGIWDDHDYGKNNGGHEYKDKELSQKFLLDFLEEPLSSPRRKSKGIFTSYTFGKGHQKIKMILLDGRFFKDELKGSLLGDTQWKWLEEEVKNSEASLHLIVSGISFLTPKTIRSEEWSDYPTDKKRLRILLQDAKIPYLYLAGDRHLSAIYSKKGEMEFLASGMTHNVPLFLRPLMYAHYPAPVFVNNFGMIDFSWEGKTPILNLSIQTAEGESLRETKIRWLNDKWKRL